MAVTTQQRLRAWTAVCFTLLALLLCSSTARASGDFACSRSWKLRHSDFTGCNSMTKLSPGNDTRINLALLLVQAGERATAPPKDGSPLAPLFDWSAYQAWAYPAAPKLGDDQRAAGEGSRCLSDTDGTTAFVAAVAASRKLDPAERTALVTARRAARPTCIDTGGTVPTGDGIIAVRSAAGKSFAGYLQGAAAFYAGEFDLAAARFGGLLRSGDPWLRETARYMLGRVAVNRAQVGAFDEWGYHDSKRPVDAQVVALAEAGLRDYLKAYPTGRYAQSARGLLRRVYWLGGDTQKLAAEYTHLFAQPADMRQLNNAELAEEIDNKLLPQLTVEDTDDPILLAVLDLRAMRHGERADEAKATITQAQLEAQRIHFARRPMLFDFLLAAQAYYVNDKASEVVRLASHAARQSDFDTVQFSCRCCEAWRWTLPVIATRATSGPSCCQACSRRFSA